MHAWLVVFGSVWDQSFGPADRQKCRHTCSLSLCWCTFPHTLVKGNKVWFFHGSTCVAHKIHFFIWVSHKNLFSHACVTDIFRFHACVSHEISIFACFVWHVYLEMQLLEKENCGKLPSLGGGAWTCTHRYTPSAMTSLNCYRQWHCFCMVTWKLGAGPTTPDHRLKPKMAPVKIHGPLASTWFLRATQCAPKKTHAYVGTTHARTHAHVLKICSTPPPKKKTQGSGTPKNARIWPKTQGFWPSKMQGKNPRI